MRIVFAGLLASALSLAPSPTPTASTSAAPLDAPQCQQQTVSVTLSALSQTQYHVVTWLCWRGSLAGKTVQVLVSGYTYDHNYWDFPYQTPAYSYVESATNAGYATLNLDRLGVGLSDHPAAALITLPSHAYVIHQLVQSLRAGAFQGTPFAKVVLVGHSLGTLISWTEASTYADVDGVIASGWLHVVNPTGVTTLTAASYPAALDPKFAGSGLSIGYLTTTPGTRGSIFYSQSDADSGVIALDETLKQTGTDGELATYALSEDPLVTLSIHVPVLAAVGQDDSIFCGPLVPCTNGQTVLQREGIFYSPHACLEGYSLPDSGHDMNLHLNAQQWYATALDWVSRRVGNGAQPPTQPCP